MTTSAHREFNRTVGDRRYPLEPSNHHGASRLIVFADGVKGVGVRPGRAISDYFLTRGDFLNVSWPLRSKFSGLQTRDDIALLCEPYDYIDLVGGSWGGLVMYDCGLRCMQDYPDKIVTLTLADAPFEGSDVSDKRGRLVSRLPGWLELPSGLNQRFMVGESPLTPSPHMSDADQQSLEEYHQELGRLTLGALASRLRAFYNRTPPTRWGMSRFHDVGCLQTPGDPVVHSSASAAWRTWVDGDHFYGAFVEGAQGHLAMFEYQQEWLAAIRARFER